MGLVIRMLKPVQRVPIPACAWFVGHKWQLFAIAITVLTWLATNLLLGTILDRRIRDAMLLDTRVQGTMMQP